ncbi:MAG TPA: hypothetical protein VGF45_22300 [Polyangia bacterium]
MVTVLLLGAGGCADDDYDQFRTYFAAEPYGPTECNEKDALLSGRRELRLYQSGNDDLAEVTRGLQRYYRRHGLSFYMTTPPEPLTLDYALDTDNGTLQRQLIERFPGVDFNDEAKVMADPALYDQILTFTLNFLFKPVTTFARAHVVGPGVTNVVLLHQLERPGFDKVFPPGGALAGLAISPPLLQTFVSSGLEEGRIWEGIDLPPDFTPMMFLDGTVLGLLGKHASVVRDLVVAHEFGHTTALVHREQPENLMFPNVAIGRSSCSDSLTGDQLTTMRTALGFSPVRQALVQVDDPREKNLGRDNALSHAQRFAPRRFVAMLRGDPPATRELLAPFVHPIH